MINLLSKTDEFIQMINLLSKTNEFIKMINLFSETNDFILKNKFIDKTDDFIVLLVKQVLAGPDMSDFRLLVKFCTFQVQNRVFDEIT